MGPTVWDNGFKPTVVYDSDCLTLWFHPNARVMHHKVHRAVRGEEWRAAFLTGAKVLGQRGSKKWLSDVRLHFILPPEDQVWMKEVWFPAVLEAGLEYCAIVKPDLAVVDLYVRRVAKAWSEAGVTSEVVDTPEAGLRWLSSVGTSPGRRC